MTNFSIPSQRNSVKDAFLGLAVGDALGVPVEFASRQSLVRDPVIGMRAYGSHDQPAGTWSDDSALAFCLAEMLCGDYSLQHLASRFVNWQDRGYWSAHGDIFDIGIATSQALQRLRSGCEPELAGGADERSNGNGSLMRILPLIFYTRLCDVEERFKIVQEVSSLTHRHIRSILGCFIYTEFGRQLLAGRDKWNALEYVRSETNAFLRSNHSRFPEDEIARFHHILLNPIGQFEIVPLEQLRVEEIHSSGYVVDTLEAALWALLTTENFPDAVLRAVNLGEDTDTTAAVVGGLAGLLYGAESIPADWLQLLARREDIEDLASRLHKKMFSPAQ